jgi:L-threonylcarbamoyladenylate synthase
MIFKQYIPILVRHLLSGDAVVIPTDTIYGVAARALDKNAVSKLYEIKLRTPEKPFIILISSVNDLALFGIHPTPTINKHLESHWPGPFSIVLDCPDPKFEYLHRGTNSLAFRLPARPDLIELLNQTGPLVAPSANPEGQPPAKNISEAKAYFDDKVSCYLDAGEITGKPSTLIVLTGDNETILRP